MEEQAEIIGAGFVGSVAYAILGVERVQDEQVRCESGSLN
jgi:hypothetical protein